MKKKTERTMIKKGEYFLFESLSYSYGGWSGYGRYFIRQAKVDHELSCGIPSHWNRDIFEEITESSLLYHASKENEFDKRQEKDLKDLGLEIESFEGKLNCFTLNHID